MIVVLRLFAFLIDLCFFVPLTYSVVILISLLTNTEVPSLASNIFFMPVAISAFERFYKGVTPGRFVMRIQLVSVGSQKLTFRSYLVRVFILFSFVPACVFLIGLIRFFVGDLNVFYYDYHLAIALFVVVFGFLIVYTVGQQSLHDYLVGASVVRVGRPPSRLVNRRVLFWPAFSSVMIMNLALFFIPELLDHEKVDYFREKTGVITESSLEHMDKMNFSSSDIDSGNSDFFKHYDGFHGFNGYVSLRKTDEKHGFSGIYDLSAITDKFDHVPAYSVLATSEGVSSSKFMDEVSLKIFEYAYNINQHRGVLVNFVSRDSFLNLVHKYTVVPRLVILVPAGESDYFWPIVLPGNGGVMTIGFSELPIEAVISGSISGLK